MALQMHSHQLSYDCKKKNFACICTLPSDTFEQKEANIFHHSFLQNRSSFVRLEASEHPADYQLDSTVDFDTLTMFYLNTSIVL